MLLEVIEKAFALIVDCLVDAQLLLEPTTLVLRPGDADNTRALELADLADDGSGCACSARHNERLTRFDFAYIEKSLRRFEPTQ